MKRYTYKHDKLKMTSLTIVFDAGSMLEQEGKKGTMHLMEHMICKTFKDRYSFLTANGVNWNAYTSVDKIVVQFGGLSSKLTGEVKLELVSALTQGMQNVTPDEFNQEKSVVIQEYLDSPFDNAEASFLNMFRKYWNTWLPIGKLSDIKSFSYDDMLHTYDKYFRKPCFIIEIGPECTEGLEDFCSDRPLEEHAMPRFGEYRNEFISVDTSVKTPVYMVFKKPVSSADYPYVRIGLEMLCSGLESPYYDELRVKRGLSYYVSNEIIKFRKNGIMCIAACTDTAKSDELASAMQELTEHTYEYLSEERFNDIMQMVKIEREKAKILKYEYPNRYIGTSRLKMPNNLDKITLDKIRYIMSRYFATAEIIKGF